MCIKGRLTKMKCCEKCGQELDANTGLCPKCDKKKTSINPKKFKKRYIIIPVAFLLICTIVRALLFGYKFYSRSILPIPK